jgi:hypothetical protein
VRAGEHVIELQQWMIGWRRFLGPNIQPCPLPS